MITVCIHGEEKQYPKGICLEKIANDYQKNFEAQILIAIQNDKIKELSKIVEKDGDKVSFLTIKVKKAHKNFASFPSSESKYFSSNTSSSMNE